MTDTRLCEQCGAEFAPRREHARFCSARCRVAWNRGNVSDPADELSPLQWSIIAMNDAADRLPVLRATDRSRGFAAAGEAVWWVTIVDATMLRHHPETYDRVMAERHRSERTRIEGTLAGLRFVRNRMGQDTDPAEFISAVPARPGPARTDGSRMTDWTWQSMPAPLLTPLTPRGQAWEMTRYEAYQTHLAGHTIGETFGRAASFLNLIAANASALAGASGP